MRRFIMRILCLTENYPPNKGGMAQSCDRIVHSLRNHRGKDIQVDVLHFSKEKSSRRSHTSMVAHDAVLQKGGSYIRCSRHNDAAHTLQLGLRALERFTEGLKPDFLLVFGGQLPLVAAPTYSRLLGIPYILCLRGNDFDHALFDHKRKASLDDAINNARAVCTVSTEKVERLKKLYPKQHIYFTPNGIDLSRWEAMPSERSFAQKWRAEKLKPGQKVIGIFGHLKNKKAIFFFLEALMCSTLQDKPYIFAAGSLDEGLQALLIENNLQHTVLPFQDRSELIKYYLACDWVAIPSFYDGMPNVMLEAGSLGIPVIGSNVDGMRDIIQHQYSGLLFSCLKKQECSLAIRECARMDFKKQLELGANLQSRIVREFTAEDEVEHYIKILETEHDKFINEELHSHRDSLT